MIIKLTHVDFKGITESNPKDPNNCWEDKITGYDVIRQEMYINTDKMVNFSRQKYENELSNGDKFVFDYTLLELETMRTFNIEEKPEEIMEIINKAEAGK